MEIRNTFSNIFVDVIAHLISDFLLYSFHGSIWDLIVHSNFDISNLAKVSGFIVGIVVFSIFSHRIYQKLHGPIKEASINVYNRRNIKLEDFLKKAKTEVYIFGIALEETLSGEYTDILEKILKSQDIKNVRILLSNPNNEQLVNSITELVNTNMTTINGSLPRIRDFINRLGEEKSKLEVKVFDGIPIQSMFIIYPHSKKGILRFEPYLYCHAKRKKTYL